jgi:hypothetical protein
MRVVTFCCGDFQAKPDEAEESDPLARLLKEK